MVNGLSPVEHPPIAFVDLDGVVFEEGTNRFIPGAPEKLRELVKTHKIVFFTARSMGSWVQEVEKLNLPTQRLGYLPKPLGCSYRYIDDRLQVAGCACALIDMQDVAVANSPAWQAKEDEERELGL